MKNFLKYVALGMCLSLPIIAFADDPTPNSAPACCGSPCDNCMTAGCCNTGCNGYCPDDPSTNTCMAWCNKSKPIVKPTAE